MSDENNVNGDAELPVDDGVNAETREQLFAEVTTLGEQAGIGKNALPALAVRIALAVARGSLTAEGLKVVPKKENDIHAVWRAYTAGEDAKKPAERSATSIKVQVSKLQAIGNAALANNSFAHDVMFPLAQFRKEQIAANKTFRARPLFDAFIEAARSQVSDPSPSGDGRVARATPRAIDEMQAMFPQFAEKPPVRDRTLTDHIRKLRDSTAKLLEMKSALHVETAYDIDIVNRIVALFDAILPETPEAAARRIADENAAKAKAFDELMAKAKADEDAAKERADAEVKADAEAKADAPTKNGKRNRRAA